MNLLTELTSQPVIYKLGWSLAHFLWQGTLITLVIWAVLQLLRNRSANARYMAACGGLLLLALAPLVTFLFVTAPERLPPDAHTPVIVIQENTAEARPFLGSNQALQASPVEFDAKPLLERLEFYLPYAVLGWLVVVFVLSMRLLGGWLEVQRLKRASTQRLSSRWEEILGELARNLGIKRPVRLARSTELDVPTVIGWLRPIVLIPAGVLTNLTPGQIEAILAHELAHIRRHDYAVNLAQKVLEVLLFYHPAVWWISRQIEIERENCCDDLTISTCGDPIAYAQALASLESLRTDSLQVALGAGGGSLVKRIRRLVGVPAETNGTAWWAAGAVGLACTAGILVLSQTWIAAAPGATTAAENQAALEQEQHRATAEIRLVLADGDDSPADESSQPMQLPGGGNVRVSQEALLDNRHFRSASTSQHVLTGRPELRLHLTDEGRKKFRQITQRRVRIAIVIDGKLMSAPVVHERIDTPTLPVSGWPSMAEAKRAAADLNKSLGGTLSVPADKGAERKPGPSNPVTPPELPGQNDEDHPRTRSITERDQWETAETKLLIQDARSMIETGKLDEAEERLRYVITREPQNENAGYYLAKIRWLRAGGHSDLPQMFTRLFKVNPTTFFEGVKRSMPAPTDGAQTEISQPDMLRSFTAALGLKFSPQTTDLRSDGPSQKSIFFNDRTGILYVRTTPDELEILDKAIQALNVQPPQVLIETKIIEILPGDAKAPSFDWILGNSIVTGAGDARARQSRPATSGRAGEQHISGILTDAQRRVVIRALEQRTGTRVVGNPNITTLSGRQAKIGVEGAYEIDLKPVVQADGHTIELIVHFSVSSATNAKSTPGERKMKDAIHINTTAQVWDGQTLVLGGLERSEGGEKKRIALLVTPTLIDPAGNRIHSESTGFRPRIEP